MIVFLWHCSQQQYVEWVCCLNRENLHAKLNKQVTAVLLVEDMMM